MYKLSTWQKLWQRVVVRKLKNHNYCWATTEIKHEKYNRAIFAIMSNFVRTFVNKFLHDLAIYYFKFLDNFIYV